MVMGTGGIGTWILAERARSVEPASARIAARSAAATPLSRAGHRRAAKVGTVAGTDGTPLDIDRDLLRTGAGRRPRSSIGGAAACLKGRILAWRPLGSDMSDNLAFDVDFSAPAEECVALSPLVRRVV